MINYKSMTPREIVTFLEIADGAYYNNNEPIITDGTYDVITDHLKVIDPSNAYLKKIGARPPTASAWIKKNHKIRMSSLDKVTSKIKFIEWARKHTSDTEKPFFVCQYKADGLSIELIYSKGLLRQAILRGDGIAGEDIIDNVRKMKNVINRLDAPVNCSLHGEILIYKKDFAELNQYLIERGQDPYKNSRNALGVCRSLNGRYCEKLTVLYYDIIEEGQKFITEDSKIRRIRVFRMLAIPSVLQSISNILDGYDDMCGERRQKLKYGIDGLVVKINDTKIQEQAGFAGELPKGQIALKFPSDESETTVQEIKWSMGTNKRITPVAILDPINIQNVEITRVSLHNMDIFRRLKLKKGDTVTISRRNDVIPYLEANKDINSGSEEHLFKSPDACPICMSTLKSEETFLVCENKTCGSLKQGDLIKWIDALKIMFISEKTIQKLCDIGKIHEPADFYTLIPADIAEIPGLGLRMGQKIVDQIQSNKVIDLPIFALGLNIYSFGSSTCTLLIKAGFKTIDQLLAAPVEALTEVHGIGKKIAQVIVDGLKLKSSVIDNLLKYVTIKPSPIVIPNVQQESKDINICSGQLSGKSFCFTGAINKLDLNGQRFTRQMMAQLVWDNGGKVLDSVRSDLTYLVQADPTSTSTKTKKAKEIGVTILGEDEFFAMVNS